MKLLASTGHRALALPLLAGLLMIAPDAMARPRDGRATQPRPTVQRQVHRPVQAPAARPVTRPIVRDHRRARGVVRVPGHRWGWWGPHYRPYDPPYGPVYGYHGPGYAPYAVGPRPATVPPRVGVGLGLSHFDGAAELGPGTGLSGALRLRGERAELELELGAQRHADDDRRDRRAGVNVYVHLADHPVVTPYLVGGLGINRIERDHAVDRQQAYVAGGAGLAFPIGETLTLSGDLRWHARWGIEDDRPSRRGSVIRLDDDERLLEGRVALMIYF